MDIQLKFCEPAIYYSEDAWAEKGRYGWTEVKALDKQAKALADKQGSMNWFLGDWLLEGVDGGLKPKKLKRRVLEITGLKLSSGRLSNLMTVSRGIELSRRREDLPYSIHEAVAKFDVDVQEKLLELAQDGGEERWIEGRRHLVPFSVRGFRAEIRKMQESGKIPRTAKARPNDTQPVQNVSLRITLRDGDFLEKLARAQGKPSVADVIGWMLGQYFKEHKAALQAEIDEYMKTHSDETDRLVGRIVPVQRPRRRRM